MESDVWGSFSDFERALGKNPICNDVWANVLMWSPHLAPPELTFVLPVKTLSLQHQIKSNQIKFFFPLFLRGKKNIDSCWFLSQKSKIFIFWKSKRMNPGMNEGVWDSVLELTKSAQEKKSDSMLWAIQLGSTLNSAGLTLPSVELSHLLISHICWNNNNPIAWKFLEKALALNFVPPMLILALLSTR